VYRDCLESCFDPDELREYLFKEVQALSSGAQETHVVTQKSIELPDWLLQPRGGINR
jgi:hypothetical protein